MAEDILGSRMSQFASDQLKPSKAGYGQNQYGGASSDLPGEHTTSGFLPQPGEVVNSQMRRLPDPDSEATPKKERRVALAHGMDQRTNRSK